MKLDIGIGQMHVTGGNVEKNLDTAARMIGDGAKAGCHFVILPECLDTGWTNPLAMELATPVPGKTSQFLCNVAERHQVHVVAGLTERDGEKVYNSAILISPDGKILLKHRKINILSIAQHLYSTGDSLRVVNTTIDGKQVKVGVLICADNFPNSLVFGHSLARMGAQVILSPCAWAVDSDHDNAKDPYGQMWKDAYSTLARLYDIPVVGVSNVGTIDAGPWKGRICIGNSIAVDAGGDVAAVGPYGVDAESLVQVRLEITQHDVTGTNFYAMLRMSGYEGP